MDICVNPLHVGELISTEARKKQRDKKEECQSPSRRGTHFYIVIGLLEVLIAVCQSPSRRGTHFYPAGKWKVVDAYFDCVNPLHVGELISTLYLIFC